MSRDDDYDDIPDALTTGAIVAIVLGSIIGFAICIGFVIITICIIKNCNRPTTHGMVLHQPHHHSWATQYQPHTTSVANYPSAEQSGLPPPYTVSALDSTRPPPYT